MGLYACQCDLTSRAITCEKFQLQSQRVALKRKISKSNRGVLLYFSIEKFRSSITACCFRLEAVVGTSANLERFCPVSSLLSLFRPFRPFLACFGRFTPFRPVLASFGRFVPFRPVLAVSACFVRSDDHYLPYIPIGRPGGRRRTVLNFFSKSHNFLRISDPNFFGGVGLGVGGGCQSAILTFHKCRYLNNGAS